MGDREEETTSSLARMVLSTLISIWEEAQV